MATSVRPPGAADATFERAVRRHLAGDMAAAASLYRQALATDPAHAAAANNLGTIVAMQGARDDAERLFRSAVATQPDYGEAFNNLGILLGEGGAWDDACACFEHATALEPGKAGWHNNHANALLEKFRFRDAVMAYDRAIAIDPTVADYWSNRALALRGLREPAHAIASLEQALSLDPDHLNAWSNLGAVLKESRRYEEACRAFEHAAAIDPANATICVNYASVFERMGDHDRLRQWARKALELDPAHGEAFNLLANVAMEEGRYDEAESLYQRVLDADPQNRNANWNLALIWLLRGDFARGWPQFEWRKRLQSVVFDHGDYGPDEWQGGDLSGRTILLHSEQGLGDAIQFVRYAPLLKARGAARVIVEAPAPVVPLLAGADGVDAVVARGLPLPPYDVHANLMSLPGACGTTLDSVPATVPYLHVEPRGTSSFVTAPPGTLKVGIVWAGNPEHTRDFLRSAPLTAFASLARVPGIRLFSLQKGEVPERELHDLADPSIVDLAPHLHDFRDTAAVIGALDLVIAVDTSVAHLAGALGTPTWVLLPHVPDFRWMLGRDDSPWYPTMRLYRQDAPRAWHGVFARVTRDLEHLARQASHVETPPGGAVVEDIVTIPSATRTPDGRPRYDLWVPLAELADPDRFAEYEAELVQGGAHLATRLFLTDLLRTGDTFVDAVPGLGFVPVEAAMAPGGPARVVIVGSGPTAQRVRDLAARRGTQCEVRLTDHAADALRRAGGRLVARVDATMDATIGASPVPPDVIVWEGVVPKGTAALGTLGAAGYGHFALHHMEGEATLDPIADGSTRQVVVSLSPDVLRELTGPSGAPARPRTLAIDWELRSDTGWGVYGINLTLDLLRRGSVEPAVFVTGRLEVSPLAAARLAPVVQAASGRRERTVDGIMLRALGNNFGRGASWEAITARRNVGVVFFEDTAFDRDAIAWASRLDGIVAGSSWNAEVLRAHGLEHVVNVPQGIDPAIFHPGPRAGLFADRFVVFSGGKLEYRKGQDLAVAAFRRFVASHPDALLLVAWHNAWPQLIADLDLAGHVQGLPGLRGESLDLVPWLVANGIPASNVIDLGRQPNAMMGQLVREADVALFPNRGEGGTNLVAMECMAAGVATVVSANTGHLDLVATGGCLPLGMQQPPPLPSRHFRAIEGWGESDVDEMVALLERLHADHELRRTIAARGAEAMARMTWHDQVGQLLDALEPLW